MGGVIVARELAIENGKLKSNLDANGNKVANLATPTLDGDAATKKYVDERPVPPSSWSDITGKPDTFPPEAHTHTKSEITDFPASMPPTAHSHASDSWFTSALEAIKSWASGAFAAITHSHAGDSWFTTALGGKIDKSGGTIGGDLLISGGHIEIGDATYANGAIYKAGGRDLLFNFDSGRSGNIAVDADFSPTDPAPYVSALFNDTNTYLTGVIDARLPYPLYAVPSNGLLKDRAINTTSLASVTVPDNFTDLLIRASVASSLAVTMPDAITTKYGDTFPAAAGEYLITITKTGAAETYVRVIKLEVANASSQLRKVV